MTLRLYRVGLSLVVFALQLWIFQVATAGLTYAVRSPDGRALAERTLTRLPLPRSTNEASPDINLQRDEIAIHLDQLPPFLESFTPGQRLHITPPAKKFEDYCFVNFWYPEQCMIDDDFGLKYVSQAENNRWHFRVVRNDTPRTPWGLYSWDPPSVTIRPPIYGAVIGQARFPAGGVPRLPPEVAAEIQKRATAVFVVNQYLSPSLFRHIIQAMDRGYMHTDPQWRPYTFDEFHGFLKVFNLGYDVLYHHLNHVDRNKWVRAPYPPREFMNIINDPKINGDGTHADIARLREVILSHAQSSRSLYSPLAWANENNHTSLVPDTLTYMTITEPEYLAVVQKIAEWMNKVQTDLFKIPPEKRPIGDTFARTANDAYDNIIEQLKDYVRGMEANGSAASEDSQDLWVGKVKPTLLRYPQDWNPKSSYEMARPACRDIVHWSFCYHNL